MSTWAQIPTVQVWSGPPTRMVRFPFLLRRVSYPMARAICSAVSTARAVNQVGLSTPGWHGRSPLQTGDRMLRNPFETSPCLWYGKNGSSIPLFQRKSKGADPSWQKKKTNVMRLLDQKRCPIPRTHYASPDGAVDSVTVAGLIGRAPGTGYSRPW